MTLQHIKDRVADIKRLASLNGYPKGYIDAIYLQLVEEFIEYLATGNPDLSTVINKARTIYAVNAPAKAAGAQPAEEPAAKAEIVAA